MEPESIFSPSDLEFIKSKGIDPYEVLTQIENLKRGFPFAELDAPATPGEGITTLSDEKTEYYAGVYEEKRGELKVVKFVPASGAASRMFKDLNVYVKECDSKGEQEAVTPAVEKTMMNLPRFAMYGKLKSAAKKEGLDVDDIISSRQYRKLAELILSKPGLDCSHKPKGLLFFHDYPKFPRTAFGEHLVEGAGYAQGADSVVHLHFTISHEHQKLFAQKVKSAVPKYEDMLGVTYDISFSEQLPKTDMVAIDSEGNLVRTPDGNILFRPGGHGALIENLNAIDADVVFVKNIDNVTVDKFKPLTYLYKKALAGYLLSMQETTFEFLRRLETLSVSEADLAQIEGYADRVLNIPVRTRYFGMSLREKVAFWQKKLNRPMRVCGMVRNEGEPGGGPFWVEAPDHSKSLQIVEASQIDFSNQHQASLVKDSSHFNPVDLVCGLRNFRGNKFNLKNYVDKNMGFISHKNQNGIDMTIQELPGLWNGAMSDWITAFVEVPVGTFTPVKTLNDLLRPEHIE